MKILIAEDDLANIKFLSKLLGRHGEVTVAEDGIKAVDLFVEALNDNEPFDLVCLDIMMPKLDGYKTLQNIRESEAKAGIEKFARAKVIMTSALDEVTNHSKVNQDYDAYMCKPIDIHDFERIIRRIGLV
ncbi:MAG: response regulator [Lachnospiraceae bacterium]|nr:response regulator [Lachnospiraceae bacterium]